MVGSSDLLATEEGNCAESDRDFYCAYRIHLNSRSADERLEPTGRLPGSAEQVERLSTAKEASGVVRRPTERRSALGAQTVRGSLQRDKAQELVDRSRAPGSGNERVGSLTAKATRSASASIAV
jgi:hypothetical protein